MQGRFVSPNDMLAAASKEMLNGRQPESRTDWANIIAFFAVNIAPEAKIPALKLMKLMYNIPLSTAEIEIIALSAQEAKLDN